MPRIDVGMKNSCVCVMYEKDTTGRSRNDLLWQSTAEREGPVSAFPRSTFFIIQFHLFFINFLAEIINQRSLNLYGRIRTVVVCGFNVSLLLSCVF